MVENLKSRPRGRPRVTDRRRKHAISMNDAEWAALSTAAKRLGVSISELIRLRCLRAEEEQSNG